MQNLSKGGNNNDETKRRNIIWSFVILFMLALTFYLIFHQQKYDNKEVAQNTENKIYETPTRWTFPTLIDGELKYQENYAVLHNISISREYQIKLSRSLFRSVVNNDNDDGDHGNGIIDEGDNNNNNNGGMKRNPKLKVRKRDDVIKEMLITLTSLFGVDLKYEDGNEEVRQATLYNAQNVCYLNRFQLRGRRKVSGKESNSTTVDFKYSLNLPPPFFDSFIYSLPFTPSSSFLPSSPPHPHSRISSLQKYELDVHACKVKISRESRVYNLDFGYEMKFCYQISELFPGVELIANSSFLPIPKLTDNDVWFVFELPIWNYLPPSPPSTDDRDHDERSSSPVNIELSFQIGVYPSVEDAVKGNDHRLKGIGSEFSFRVWSPNNATSSFPPNLILHFDLIYRQILDHFGSEEQPCHSPSPFPSPLP